MIAAALLVAAQAGAPVASADLFMGVCAAGLRDPAAFRDAAARAGFAPAGDNDRMERFRAGAVVITYVADDQCRLVAPFENVAPAVAMIAEVSARLDLPAPRAIAMHPPGWTRYSWPVPAGGPPSIYLVAHTFGGQQEAVDLELTIVRGPGQ